MVKEVLLATRNQGKIREFATLLSPVFERVTSLRELYSVPDIVAGEKENIKKLLKELSGVGDRRARFVCALALVFPDGLTGLTASGREIVVEGRCDGIIVDDPRGESGFGYDPVFLVPQKNKTMAELTPEEKNQISHRALAVRKLIMCLNNLGINK